ncbi:hypothetical protein F5X99DRAFT_369991 [Biscogniauxia marginata]|nr:hypothetical protein F5X99DRAFT_369991 [Biscogniauxia marginata]
MTEQLNAVARKRRRPAKSCEPCRSRKIKCDRGLPCSPCKRSRAALLCSYKSRHPLSPVGSSEPTVSSHGDLTGSSHIDARLDHGISCGLVATESRIQTGTPQEPSDHINLQDNLARRVRSLEDVSLPNSRHVGHDYHLQDLEARIAKIEQQLSASTRNQSASNITGLHISLPCPHLRIGDDKTRLFGSSHWVHSLGQFQTVAKMQVKPYSVIDTTQAETAATLKEIGAVRRLAKGHGAGRLQDPMPDLVNTIPARNICDRATECYLRTFEPIFRVLHVPSFKRDYEEYWSHQDAPKTTFLMKFIMVLAIGAVFLPDQSVFNQIRSVSREWAYAVQWWLIGPTERDAMNLDGVQIFCLLLLARQTTSLGGASSIITEALLKLCFTLGLHVDPQTFRCLSVFESELRRRLWTTALELITITSMNSTLPLSISVDDFQLYPASNIPDDDLKEDNELTTFAPHSRQGVFDCSLQLLLSKSLRLRIQLIRQLNNLSQEYFYESVLESGKALMAHCRDIAAFFQSRTSDGNEGISLSEFHMRFLDTYMRRIILFIHRPFAVRARNDPHFFLSRKVCLESSIIMASYAEKMDLSSRTLDDFSRLCIRGSGLFKGALSQDVISAISLEVITQLEEERSSSHLGSRPSETTDPLTMLSRANRVPLLRTLNHIREQWRQIMLLGRPSLKQYLFLSVILSQIRAMEMGQNPKLLVFETFNNELKECAALLRQSGLWTDKSESIDGWMDDISPYDADTFGIFGFDLNSFDPSLTFDVSDWLIPPNTLGSNDPK